MRFPSRKLAAAAIVCGLGLVLAGCDSEPSSADMLKAYNAKVEVSPTSWGSTNAWKRDAQERQAREMLADSKLEKSGCVRAQNAPGYVCDFRWGTKINGQFQYNPSQKARFFKSGDAWTIEPVR